MIYLFGAGGHAKVILEILESLKLKIGGLINNVNSPEGLLGYPVYAENELAVSSNASYILAIGDNHIRKKMSDKFALDYACAVHRAANISTRTTIAQGSVIMAGVSINSDTKIGKHAIVNTNASIDHDCVIGNYAHISPNAALAGNVTVGEGTQVGIGACIIQGITIGKWVIVGAGAVVINDIPDYAVAVGNPAKIIKYNQIDE